MLTYEFVFLMITAATTYLIGVWPTFQKSKRPKSGNFYRGGLIRIITYKENGEYDSIKYFLFDNYSEQYDCFNVPGYPMGTFTTKMKNLRWKHI